ncbi:methionine adenosyltransferase [Entomospira culicis]|uniref:S-adenosylmethionine synthase n=1 Tax=Entomospira culicis TaxID=2719989 RepID=A0A968KU77_9SPIO|nr:methionine adenosyltransferase [Entomospira culicis]NIZ19029.1 methionine adenosyltransferase [Entomospira culicis]NIZ69244.1 methionine adenosyltransferase [Entomospira culicis]WDI37828.1 methionine adenosyltransferase [Entomospira culicis]WDI39456.1 methionine adenosyltransferase [Entomospira culicis]
MSIRKSYTFTSESVGEGHPDKICDQISDAILDEALRADPESRVACEVYASTGMVIVGGEITTDCYIDVVQSARDVLKNIGYDHSEYGINYKDCAVLSVIKPQSPDIAMGVDASAQKEQGAGDQGIMFGYACSDTPNYMPATLEYAHAIVREAARVRKSGVVDFLRPDCKAQVSMVYENGMPKYIDTVVLSHQHGEQVDNATLRKFLQEEVIAKAIPSHFLDEKTTYHINPTGRFIMGGPQADVGLTGRKIIVDTYGGAAAHGGGAFSGKDPSKVDRSAAYMARYIAKNLVAAGVAPKIQVELAYAIGVAEPVSIFVETYDNSTVDGAKLEAMVREIFALKPADIVRSLDLKRPVFLPTASYGHFGRAEFSWEQLDKVADIKSYLGW